MNVKIHIILVLLASVNFLAAQTIPKINKKAIAKDSIPLQAKDSMALILSAVQDSIPTDSLLQSTDSLALSKQVLARDSMLPNQKTVAMSKDSLDAQVLYESQDSMVYDIANEEIHLYGQAKVQYQDINLEADYIILRWSDNSVTAVGTKDSLGNVKGKPKFTEKDQTFDAGKMRYNFVTRKGIIYDASSTYSDMYILGQTAKFSSAGSDSLAIDDHVYSSNAAFTTCNHPTPHFCIRSKRQKVVPNKTIVVGPSNLEIANIPTPIWLPFGFFPIHNQPTNGLIFPQDFEYSDDDGFGLNEVGWYFPINDNIDLRLTGDIYFLGTHRIRARSNYKKRYKYNGNFLIEYAGLRRESSETGEVRFQKSIKLNWSHNQDSKAHPLRSIGGSVNFQTSNHQAANYTDAPRALATSLSSNINFTRQFPGKPYSLNISATHSQNTQSGNMTINLPTVRFNVNTIYPFKSKKPKPKEAWYEKISVDLNSELKNTFTAKDSTLFRKETLDDAKYGAKHTFNTRASYTILKYFRFNARANYTETWFFKTLDKNYDLGYVSDPDTLISLADTILQGMDTLFIAADTTFDFSNSTYGQTSDSTHWGWKPLRQYSFNAGISTTLFGTMLFKKGFLRGIRHKVDPSINFNYTPDYTKEGLGYFKQVRTSVENDSLMQQYSVFQNGIYSGPSSGGKQMALQFSIGNRVELKYWSKKDSSFQKFNLLESASLSWNYNFANEETPWSNPAINARTNLFKRITNISFGASFSPYTTDEEDKPVLLYKQNKQLVEFRNANLNFSNSISVKKILEMLSKKKSETSNDSNASNQSNGNTNDRTGGSTPTRKDKSSTFLEFFDQFSLTYNLYFRWMKDAPESFQNISTNNLSVRGNFQLTDKWRLSIGQIGYDFKDRRVTYPDFQLYRDLHCWEMNFSWQPTRGTYNFGIRVKPSTLGFIDVPYKKTQADAFRF